MASIYKESKSSSNSSSGLDLLEHIKRLVEEEHDKVQLNYDEFLFFLKRWWCNHYKRPYKDPLLDTYTFEELYFEYCDVNYIKSESSTEDKPENIPQGEYDWAAEEDAKEMADLQAIEEMESDKKARVEDDTIVDESVGLPDDKWADRYTDGDVKLNPNAEIADEGGDIFANFES
jgi:hypothetical protein